MRLKLYAAFLAGVLTMYGALRLHEAIMFQIERLDGIEHYLVTHPIPQLELAPPSEQPAQPQSHKGELRQPDQWKV